MFTLLFAMLSFVHVVDASSGRSLPQIVVSVSQDASDRSRSIVEARGAPFGYADFHGSFSKNAIPESVRVMPLSQDERQALDRINAFRARFRLAPLAPDENLTETARYWAREERIAGRIGHTCAALGSPAGCTEFNTYFHRLPGAPLDWFAGQNAAFDTFSSWRSPVDGFEQEGSATTGERGHFENLIDAARWIGLGETRVDGYGSYFAMNLI